LLGRRLALASNISEVVLRFLLLGRKWLLSRWLLSRWLLSRWLLSKWLLSKWLLLRRKLFRSLLLLLACDGRGGWRLTYECSMIQGR
jgi:hypothetical protein